MGMDLKNLNLLSLMPKFMQHDQVTLGLCASIQPQFRQLSDEAKVCLILPRIKELKGPILDELAWELHIDFWDASAEVEQKRELIRNSFIIHMTKGTPAAVERLIQTMFNDGYVEEWFEYGGDPYMFRVITNNASVTTDKAAQFIRALDSVKNLRSWLEKVIITLSETMNFYYAGIVHTGENLTIRQVG